VLTFALQILMRLEWYGDAALVFSHSRSFVVAGGVAGAFAVLACSSSVSVTSAADADGGGPSFGRERTTATFPADASPAVQARFVLNGCVGGPESGCHGLGAGGMVLPDGLPSHLVGISSQESPAMLRVKPGDPAGSYLYRKIVGGPGIDGGRMPLGLAALDTRSIEAVAAWIEAGASPP